MNDPTARYRDLGPDWHTKNLDTARKTRDLGHDVTLTPAGA
jgi:transposase